jgi:hypothetical protein
MVSYSKAARERAMKVQEVILRAMAKRITWWQAAEIIGISDRHMRRWRERYQAFGYDGLFDRRRGTPSPKRVPLAQVEQVLGLYREEVFRSQRAAFSREAAGGAPGGAQLHLGEAGLARSRAGTAGTETRGASQTTTPACAARDASCCTGREPGLVASAEGRLVALPAGVMARLCGLVHAGLSDQLEGSPPLRRTRVGSVRLGRGSDRPGARLPGRRNVPRLDYLFAGRRADSLGSNLAKSEAWERA